MGAETQSLAPDGVSTFMQAEDATIEELARSGLLKSEQTRIKLSSPAKPGGKRVIARYPAASAAR